jgi:hypothetical protein
LKHGLAKGVEAGLTIAQVRFPVVKASDFTFANKQPVIEHPFPDVTFLSIHFDFNTATGPAYGVAALVWEDQSWKAFTVFTLLEGIHGQPQKVGSTRKRGTHNDELSYDDRRAEEREFTDGSPDVLISESTSTSTSW